jgi:CTP synthase
MSKLHLSALGEPDLRGWQKIADRYTKLSNPELKGVHIALVGKYTNLSDAYHSVVSALQHAALKVEEKLVIDWIEASSLEQATKISNPEVYEKAWEKLKSVDGILVPGGFGDRGVEGKIMAINYARTNNVPFFGICLGMQLAVIETCRNVLGWKGANSTEFDEGCDKKVVIFMPDVSRTYMGGTMRLGKRVSRFKIKECNSYELYGYQELIEERHRHRYEINPDLVPEIEKGSNLRFVAQDDTGKRMEIVEVQGHPYFVACQYHPEFKSRPLKASPLFVGLMLAASKKLKDYLEKKKVNLKSPTGSPDLKDLKSSMEGLNMRGSADIFASPVTSPKKL